ncbi:MAG TPA: trigger factor [Vicinamibacterales bacterium]|jgi:trigger factor|nr:trigger factor [Vicinamibacterales bacterium]
MKTEFTDVSETRKTLTIEIPSDIVDAEINKVAKDYSKQAKLPGFRPGKVPATIVKQRFKDQILHDVMHGLIPRAVEEALQERGIEPVDTPNIKDVVLEEGQPLKFTAAVETVPAFDPGDLGTLSATRPSAAVTDEAVEQMLQRLRERSAKFEPVEGRAIADGDTAVLDIDRRDVDSEADRHENVSIEIGGPANPPGFDANLIGLSAGEEKTFTIHFPADYAVKEMADTDVTYVVKVKDVRRKALPELDDEFAKDLGAFDSLAALREKIRADLEEDARESATRQVRSTILKQLSDRVTFDLPASLVEREIDRRLEEFARQLMQQNVDPRQAGIDWAQFREAQRDPARAAVASALALDEIARRENITVAAEDVDKEIERFAARAGRTPAALRAQLEKEGGVARLYAGLRREKAVDLALTHATITDE